MSASNSNPLHIDFCGLSFDSPIVLLSGCVGFGEEYTRVEGFSNRDVGAIVLKGTTHEPRLGNPPHRICETPMGMLNAIGLANVGLDRFIAEKLPAAEGLGTVLIGSIAGNSIEDYRVVAEAFDGLRRSAGGERTGGSQGGVGAHRTGLSRPTWPAGRAAPGSDPCGWCVPRRRRSADR